MKAVCIADTHDRHAQMAMPPGDILIHAGDFTFEGDKVAVEAFNAWLGALPYTHKIVIAGNHEWGLYRHPELFEGLLNNCIYLRDREVTVAGLRIYGAPWTPEFGNWAFMKRRGPELFETWEKIPEGLDILVTHGPPYGIGDRLTRGEHVGDTDLRRAIERKRPRFHVAGHIHCGYGERTLNQHTRCLNAAICDEAYEPVHAPIVVEL